MAQAFCPHCSAPLPAGAAACRSCGRPAGRPTGDRATRVIVGVVVGAGCLLVGLFVLGIVAALVVPNFLSARDRAAQIRTVAVMRQLAAALESYRASNGSYPGGDTLVEVVGALAAHGAAADGTTDGWGHELHWRCVEPQSDGCTSYELRSPGRDGAFSPAADGTYTAGAFPAGELDSDIVLGDGRFLRWPEGEGRSAG